MPTTTQDNPLWNLQAQYLPGTFQAATELYNQGAPAYYPGQTVADFDPVKAQGLNLGIDAALGAQTDLANTYATQLGGIAGGTDAYTQQLAGQAANATNYGFGQAGTLGSARHANAANQAASNTIANRQLDALSQIPAAQQAALAPGQTLSQIGGTTQDYQQQLLDADKDRYDYTANQPFDWLNQYQQTISAPGFSSPTTTNQKATGLETATGWLSFIDGAKDFLGFAEGGDTTEAWRSPVGSHQWQMVDGRYQYMPTPGGSRVGGGTVPRGYIPTAIEIGEDGTTSLAGSGGGDSGGGGGQTTVATDEAGIVAPYLGADQWDTDGNDSFLTNEELATASPEEQYLNNQVIYGTDTGNNVTSLTTGGLSPAGTIEGGIADLAALAANHPTYGVVVPDYYSEPVFGDSTQAQVDAHESSIADEWGSVLQDDGTYDISAWFSDTPGEGNNSSDNDDSSSDTGGGWSESSWNPSNWFAQGGMVKDYGWGK